MSSSPRRRPRRPPPPRHRRRHRSLPRAVSTTAAVRMLAPQVLHRCTPEMPATVAAWIATRTASPASGQRQLGQPGQHARHGVVLGLRHPQSRRSPSPDLSGDVRAPEGLSGGSQVAASPSPLCWLAAPVDRQQVERVVGERRTLVVGELLARPSARRRRARRRGRSARRRTCPGRAGTRWSSPVYGSYSVPECTTQPFVPGLRPRRSGRARGCRCGCRSRCVRLTSSRRSTPGRTGPGRNRSSAPGP